MTAAERILQKALVTSPMDSEEWSHVQAGLRDRAFFSATVEEARVLHEARECAAAIADGRLSGSEARVAVREVLASTGHPDANKPGEQNLKNLSSRARIDLIMEQNVRESRGFVRYKEGMSTGALAAFPAQELRRVRNRKEKRDWATRWRDAGGKFFDGRMIALKTDAIWTKISRFDHPWPPFDFGSGMGVRDISRAEAIRLGVIKPEDPPPKPPVQKKNTGMNDGMESRVTFNRNDPEWANLKRTFGDQIQMDGNVVKWRGEAVRENFDPGKNFRMKLGSPSKALSEKVKLIDPQDAEELQKMGDLIMDNNFLNKKREDGQTDHRIHFTQMSEFPESKPLEIRDLELLPSIWRNPDRVYSGGSQGSYVLEIDNPDGDVMRLIVGIQKKTAGKKVFRTAPKILTFYRTTKNESLLQSTVQDR